MNRVQQLMQLLVDRGGSDLHLTAGCTPYFRLQGSIVPVGDTLVEADELVRDFTEILGKEKVDKLFRMTFEDEASMGAVLIKDGYIIQEQYAEGFNENSFGTSWSTAKSFYAALVGISLDRGEIKNLDEPVANYVDSYKTPEKQKITIRQILNMTSGLEFPDHEHEMMFLEADHLKYAEKVDVENPPGEVFQYNNVNSMMIGEILKGATGKTAKVLLEERILVR